jgi:hypothetical protein
MADKGQSIAPLPNEILAPIDDLPPLQRPASALAGAISNAVVHPQEKGTQFKPPHAVQIANQWWEREQSNQVHLEARPRIVVSGGAAMRAEAEPFGRASKDEAMRAEAEPFGVTADSGRSIGIAPGNATYRLNGEAPTMEVTRAPFSESGIAEALARDPAFYRQLMQFAATTLRRDAENYPVRSGEGNSAAVIKTELIATAEKFENAAAVLDGGAPDGFAAAARMVVEIRDQIVGFTKNYPALTKAFLQFSGVALGTFILCKLGVDATWSGLITTVIVTADKLSNFLGGSEKE